MNKHPKKNVENQNNSFRKLFLRIRTQKCSPDKLNQKSLYSIKNNIILNKLNYQKIIPKNNSKIKLTKNQFGSNLHTKNLNNNKIWNDYNTNKHFPNNKTNLSNLSKYSNISSINNSLNKKIVNIKDLNISSSENDLILN